MSVDQINRMRYFFWNNFNMEGYEEYINKTKKLE